MELVNATKMHAGYTMGMEPSGRESIVVAVKGTFEIPSDAGEPKLAAEQEPLVTADTFTGAPGLSSMLYESEFAPVKPRCDVLFNGSAYAPGGKPVERVRVTLRLGSWVKSLMVVGDRYWSTGFAGFRPSDIKPFSVMPISYDRAWGGSHASERNPDEMVAYLENPIGCGYYLGEDPKKIVGRPLPNTEVEEDPISRPAGKHRPIALGAISRNFAMRVSLAGTYDDKWLAECFPFLPEDFDARYYQSAPPDQQITHPLGGEEVELTNLTPEGRTRFRLPKVEVPVEFTSISSERSVVPASLDTIIIEPDLRRFMLVWRASIKLNQNIFEIRQGVVGRMPSGWYLAREVGKAYHATLPEAIAAQQLESRD